MLSNVIVCGLGQLGFRVASLLLTLGETVTIVTTDAQPEWSRALEGAGAKIVYGDAQDATVLIGAGVLEAKSLIGCCNNDLINIQIAFEARRARPDLRIVLRLFDQNLARHVVKKLGVEAALGMAALSAPSFAASSLGEDVVGVLDIDGERCVVARATVNKLSGLEGLTAEQVNERHGMQVLTWYRGADLEIMPASNTLLKSGDCIKLFGTDDAFEKLFKRANVDETPPHHALFHSVAALSPIPIAKFLWRLWTEATKELKAVFISMIVLVGVSYFVIARFMLDHKQHISPLDALYFVITTITTTGYGDITVKDQSALVEWYGIFLMLLGSFIFAALYSLITDYLVNARLQQLMGTKRVPDKGHVILVGLGIVGYRVLEELNRRNTSVVVIEQNPSSKFLGSARTRASVLIGDARDEETLNAAGVKSAKAVIACTGDDAMNLAIGLASHSISDQPRRVLRIFDADLAAKVEQAFDIDDAMSASKLAAPHFVANAEFGKCAAAFVARSHLFGIDVAADQTDAHVRQYFIDVKLGKVERKIRICVKQMVTVKGNDADLTIWHEAEAAPAVELAGAPA